MRKLPKDKEKTFDEIELAPAKPNTALDKKIKKHLYGKPQTILCTFPPGFGSTALEEVKAILANLWLPRNVSGPLLTEDYIRINEMHLFTATELLMRSQCLSDLHLVIAQGKITSKFAFKTKCEKIPWEYYLSCKMKIRVRVKSIASLAFHEGALKEILEQTIMNHLSKLDDVNSSSSSDTLCTDECSNTDDTSRTGENSNTTMLDVKLYKNKLTISLSLAGDPLYKRGYREVLSQSAPLREDIAACCMRYAVGFTKPQRKHELLTHSSTNSLPKAALIPFSGTGTFALEYWLFYFNFSPVLLGRKYAIEVMPFFRPENFNFLLKKARAQCSLSHEGSQLNLRLACIDSSDKANSALKNNLVNLKNKVLKNEFKWSDEWFLTEKNDFLKMDVVSLVGLEGDLLIPLNPPYGIRLLKEKDTVLLYKKIAEKINNINAYFEKSKKKIVGFILCPTEETWRKFNSSINTKTKTYHITQGGLDIRVCQFSFNKKII